MKKTYIFIVFILIFSTGCDRYWVKKPNDYHNSIWVSINPYLEIKVDENGDTKNKMRISGELVEVDILYRGVNMVCEPSKAEKSDSNIYFRAICKYSKEKCVIIIKEKKEGILEDVDEIVLVNQAYKDK